jgi:hypothetical protein
MESILKVIGRKPLAVALPVVVYVAATTLIKWKFIPAWDMVWYALGGILGMYLFDLGEWFFGIRPSPLRSLLFLTLFAISSLFIVTSATGVMGVGVVLGMYADLSIRTVGDAYGNADRGEWFTSPGGTSAVRNNRLTAIAFGVLFLAENFLFLR